MKKRKKLWNTLSIVILFGFYLLSVIIGGTAGNGYQEHSQYFVGDHTEFVEVSETLWRISGVWEILFWIFLVLSPIGFLIKRIQKIKKTSD